MSSLNASGTYYDIPVSVIQQITDQETHETTVVLAVLLGVVTWDTIVLLPEDVNRWRSHGIIFLDVAYIWMRIMAILSVAIYLVVELAGSTSSSFNCFAGFVVTCHFYGQALLGVNVVFIIRTLSIWNWNKLVGAIIIFLAIAQALVGFIAVPFAFAQTYNNPIGSPCLLILFWQKYFTPAFALELAFDFTVFAFSLYKLYYKNRSQEIRVLRLQRILLRDGFIYFIVLLVCNLLNTLFSTIPGISPLLTENWNYVTIVIVSIAGAFVYHSIRRESTRRSSKTTLTGSQTC
ncbi:hypothetical protein V501_00635 [Pseudogymnoascus sp. VKM F-4519 (FW-2642)]|nr:hypothetical protein V501_00635 [Pseudogymnoascus sp. VKM F-4519 (FW-2642)]